MFQNMPFVPSGGSRPDSGVLRTPEWSEFVARLAAARELREELQRGPAVPLGSFTELDSEPRSLVNSAGQDVNHPGLAGGKGPAPMMARAANFAVDSGREPQ